MPLAELLAALEREGESKARAELLAARAEAERLRVEAAARIAARRRDALAAREAELAGVLQAELSRARREARVRVLMARERMLDRVFETALRSLAEACSEPWFASALRAQVGELLACFANEPVVLRCRPEFVDTVREACADRHDASVEPDSSLTPGVLALARSGAVRADETLAARFERMRPFLRVALVRELSRAR